MNIRIAGAILVVLGCGSVGFRIAAAYRYEERILRQLLNALDFMQCELQYRLTPLPELCRRVGVGVKGMVGDLFLRLGLELETQLTPDVSGCMERVLSSCGNLPGLTRQALEHLGGSLGRFDLDGQLLGLEATRRTCRESLEELTQDKSVRLRSYQTLGLCAGAALAILFI